MKAPFLVAAASLLLFCSCHKTIRSENLSTPSKASQFKEYLILQGAHYTTENPFKSLDITALKFTVKFDSSAIYQTTNLENQYDINKLYGFADNAQHHQQYSARFGWRWSDGALRLFAYTYNNGVRDSKELGTVRIGAENKCAIQVTPSSYVFKLNDKVDSMERLSKTPTAVGYQLYPYFGGDEVAPHPVKIQIKED